MQQSNLTLNQANYQVADDDDNDAESTFLRAFSQVDSPQNNESSGEEDGEFDDKINDEGDKLYRADSVFYNPGEPNPMLDDSVDKEIR